MVRALPFRTPSRLDFGRIVAMAAAIALHLVALLLLLMPMAAPQLQQIVEKPERWVLPLPKLVEPKPLDPVPVERPKIVQKQNPQPVSQPVPVTQQPNTTSPIDTGTLQANEGAVDQGPSNDIGPVDTTPMVGSQLQYVTAPPPPYPRAEQRGNVQGTVTLRILVDVDGKPLEVSVETSSGNRNLDRAASQQVLKYWTFKPAVRNGVNVQAYGLVPISFSLQ